MRKVLLISFFWPPSGKATIHWPLYMAKYLKKYDWQTSVLTVKEDTFSEKDESLMKDVDSAMTIVRTRPNDPFALYRRFIGKKQNEPLVPSETISKKIDNWRYKFAIWIRMNLFVPDARIGWYLSAPKGGKKIIETEKPSVIITIGPPHSTHLIGMKLSKRYKIPHVPVLIDPWVDIAYYREFKRNIATVKLDNYFESSVLHHARAIIFVTKQTREHYILKYPDIENKSHVCYWGYNEESFKNVKKQPKNEETLLHAGNIFDFQNPPNLWKALHREILSGRKLRLKFAGTVSPVIRRAIQEAGLEPFSDFLGFLSYPDVVQEMMNADYLLVCATEPRHVPGKLFEYMRTGNRIIAFGDDNEEVAQLLRVTNSGKIFPYSYHCNDIFERLSQLTPNPEIAKQFSREKIAEELAQILSRSVS